MKFGYLLRYYGKYKLKMITVAALCLVSTLCSLAIPSLMSTVVDDGVKAEKILADAFPEIEIKRKGNELLLPKSSVNSAAYGSLLVKSGVSVEELAVSGGGLEDYFIERLGK